MKLRQAAFVAAKLLFAAGAIWLLFHKVSPAHVWNSIRSADLRCILGGTVLFWFGVGIAGWRWHRLLQVFTIHIPVWSLICIVQVGQFFMVFLPGPTGDDLTRMLYISRLAKGRVGEACSTVLIDRIIGLASILLLALVCIPKQWHILATSRQTTLLAVGVLAGGAVVALFGAGFFLAGHPTHRWFERRLRSLPAHSVRDELARIWGLLCNDKKAVGQIIGAAVGTQLLLCAGFYLAGLAVGIHIPFLLWLGFVPVVLAANAIPITLAGIGVREYLLILFLGVLANVPSERALAASFVAFSMMLIVCLFGGVVYLVWRPAKPPESPTG